MDILLADALPASCVERLERAGHAVINSPGLKPDALVAALASNRPTVLVVRSTKVTAEMMEADPNLELIVRAGAGYDTIDVNAASERGIFVSNCPGKNADAVAELTIGLILSIDRRIPDNVGDSRNGVWNKALYSKAQGLRGRTLGLIGLGHIGQRVATIAAAMGLPVVAWSRSLTDAAAERIGIRRCLSPLEVAAAADVVSLHVSSTSDTRHLANRVFFEAMKPAALFINTTRAAVVDEEALAWALEAKGIRAGLDVFEGEPTGKDGAFTHPLAGHPRVYITHHIGASTEQAQDAIADEAIRIVEAYDADGHVPNCVNLAERSPATHLLTMRHLDKVGVLANVLDEVRKAGWNVQEMENLIFSGAKAACARIWFDGTPSDATLANIRNLPDILAVSVIAL
jgi:D-3-phosphoglycerate dehydrogenase